MMVLLNEATVDQLGDELSSRFPNGLIIMGDNGDPSLESDAYYLSDGSVFSRIGMAAFILSATEDEFSRMGIDNSEEEEEN